MMAKPIIVRNRRHRNEKCPCGSGKKFKHCCIKRQSADVEQRLNEYFQASER